MKKTISILFIYFTLFSSCNRTTRDHPQSITKDSVCADSSIKNTSYVKKDRHNVCTTKDKNIVHFAPIKIDTIIKDVHVSYLIHDNEDVVSAISYDDRGTSSITKYADRTILVNIERNNKTIILNRAIKKLDFISIVPSKEIHKYEFSSFEVIKVDNNGVVFFVNLCIPDTDNCYTLNLIISDDGNFTIKEIDEKEED